MGPSGASHGRPAWSGVICRGYVYTAYVCVRACVCCGLGKVTRKQECHPSGPAIRRMDISLWVHSGAAVGHSGLERKRPLGGVRDGAACWRWCSGLRRRQSGAAPVRCDTALSRRGAREPIPRRRRGRRRSRAGGMTSALAASEAHGQACPAGPFHGCPPRPPAAPDENWTLFHLALRLARRWRPGRYCNGRSVEAFSFFFTHGFFFHPTLISCSFFFHSLPRCYCFAAVETLAVCYSGVMG